MIKKVKRREKVEETFRLLIEGICSKANMRKKQQIENASKKNRWKLSSKYFLILNFDFSLKLA
ncbi:PC4 and SFRS1 interacting protein 1 [Phyllostomus discolor]|uniref:PC4 and SFRS1 interacting protein 1 n=1 Tax=Phyllostomus discolor TaxID=89673 RepID=A0A834BB57_9CHIR|nr:PC4 and SFRS1 interacting protein 1 [Phyllostomus discolor]